MTDPIIDGLDHYASGAEAAGALEEAEHIRQGIREIERLRETENAVKRLFMGSAQWMHDGDADQWAAFDFLASLYAKKPIPIAAAEGDKETGDG